VQSKSVWLFIFSLFAAAPASADIFKCVGKNALVVYQNFPCEIDTLGSAPSDARAPGGAASPTKPDPKAKPVAAAVPAATVKPPAVNPLPAVPQVGMTSDEVKAIWGEPVEIIQDEPRSGRVEIWQYADGRSVQLNHRQRVLSVQQQ
jgi:hypothetical protein